MVAAPPAIIAPAPRPFVPVLQVGDAVPSGGLVDQTGREFSFAATGGRTTIVSFVYTRCRDARMCPLVAAKFARLQRDVSGTPIRLVIVTLDPAYDTPPVLARYGAAYHQDPRVWTLVTGTPNDVETLAERFGIAIDRPLPSLVVHSEAAIVVDARGRVARIIDGAAWLPADLLASAQAVSGMRNDGLVRLRLWLESSAGALCGGRALPAVTAGGALLALAAVTASFAVLARRAFR